MGFLIGRIFAIAAAAILIGGGVYIFSGLPDTGNMEQLELVAATQVFDVNGELIAKLFEENRIIVTMNQMSPYLAQAIVANEDTRFYRHFGIDPIGIARAMLVNLRYGAIVEGGSTITQQLAREMFLNQERTLVRKIREAILAMMIDFRFSKEEILQAYLNQVYFGEGTYGVEAAAQVYFGKHARELTLGESAMIAGLARGPSLYSPYRDMNAALARRSVVLAGMVENGFITPAEKAAAEAEPLALAGKKERAVQASYFIDYIANQLVDRYGATRVYRRGLKVYTTLDIRVQRAAEKILGDYQGALVAMDPRNGQIRAMVGGNNYQASQINRVTADVRQPGSAFKPFIYAVALNQGLTANAVVIDEPVDIAGYAPQNYDKKHHGPMTLKKALRWSVNTVAVKLAQQVGIGEVLKLAASMGITTLTPEDDNLAAALGGLTRGVNLLELSAAYTAFANQGILSKPTAIVRVEDEYGHTLDEFPAEQKAVLGADVSYILTDMLMGSLYSGTATAANLGREAAGKTGTTDHYETAWFIGYTPELLAGIYVGNDDRRPVGISGSQVAGMWGRFMTEALRGTPASRFPVPDNVVTGIPICAATGKLADSDCADKEYSAFVKGTQPMRFMDKLKSKLFPDKPQETPADKNRPKEKHTPWWLKLPQLPGF